MNRLVEVDNSIDGLDFYETVNVTKFNTNTTTFNVIPPQVELITNFRFSPQRSGDEALELLYKYLGNKDITVLDKAESCYIGNSGDNFLLPGIEKEIMQAWTDIAQLNAVGVPAINYGAGSIKHAHKPNERISIAELEDFYKKLIEHI